MKIDFISSHHKKTKRNYLERVINIDKAKAATIAKKWAYQYWDGSRDINYGGYYYDGRWSPIAKKMINYYKLNNKSKILDVGCGKGFLLYEFHKLLPGCQIFGQDISSYAIKNSKKEIRKFIKKGSATNLKYKSNYFDLVISLNTLHNLYCFDLVKSLEEIERVSKKKQVHMC